MSKRSLRNVNCVNCGEKGHVIKECTESITSFGIIAFKNEQSNGTLPANTDCVTDRVPLNKELSDILDTLDISVPKYPNIQFLMIQRKDTFGYVDFIRGKYEDQDDENLKIYFNEMTPDEKFILKTKTFHYIWNRLWNNKNSRIFLNEYEIAKKKFENLNISKLIDESETPYTFQEFSFPKGRRNIKETNNDCAEREFKEETGYDNTVYDYIEYPIIIEDFIGTNNLSYKHIYYLVKFKNNISDPAVNLNNQLQMGEVKNIGWFTYEESMMLIRPYDIEKKKMLTKLYNDIIKMNEYNIKSILTNNNTTNILTLSEIYNSSNLYLIESNF
jgi:ADP-ribose pyrophosphatase YjhB (NUDIX family)